MKTVIFDLDGTLVDTGADLVAAANECFRRLGHGDMLDPETDKATAFRGARAMLRLGLERLGRVDEAVIDAQYPALLDYYGDNIDVHSVLYPGVEAAIDDLRHGGYGVAICTNKPAGLAETLMQRLGARDWFSALVGADTLPVRKPDPAPFLLAVERAGGTGGPAMLVGDTETDHRTARAAGVPSVLVTFGPLGRSVADLEPDALLDGFADLGDVTRRLLG